MPTSFSTDQPPFWPHNFTKIMKFLKKSSNFISHLKEHVRKWTGSDEKTRKEAGKEGKMGQSENLGKWAKSCPHTKICGYIIERQILSVCGA